MVVRISQNIAERNNTVRIIIQNVQRDEIADDFVTLLADVEFEKHSIYRVLSPEYDQSKRMGQLVVNKSGWSL